MPNAIFAATALLACVISSVAPAFAHHSFAMFNLTEHKLIEGRVTEWNYNNPHSWLHIEGLDENGELKTWSFEGAAMVHAARQGVNGNTFRKGEAVKVVMSPLRDGRTAGAMCFVVKEDGTYVRPNDGVCDSVAVIEKWQTNEWIEKGNHLDVHPSDR
jgi:uncharacterized protein DUF6152